MPSSSPSFLRHESQTGTNNQQDSVFCHKRVLLIRVLFSPMMLFLFANQPTEAEEALDIGSKEQLFIDRVLVEKSDGVKFTQHPGRKHPANPLIKADRPWEGWRVYLFGSVLYDEQEHLFKMWYVSDQGGATYGAKQVPNAYFEGTGFDCQYLTCYATSKDGIHWDKPLVGTVPSKSGKRHNAVIDAMSVTVIKDEDDPDPIKRYKMLGYSRRFGKSYRSFISPDGLNWELYSDKLIAPYSDWITGFWDPHRKLYVAFIKRRMPWRGQPSRRLACTITSPDFKHWSEPILSWKTDSRDESGVSARIEQALPMLDQPVDTKAMHTAYYPIGVYPAESCTVAFPTIFTISSRARWGNEEGPFEIQLAVSRDLYHWKRPFRSPVIEHGAPGTWDCGLHTPASYAITVGNEVWLYYGGHNLTHGTPALYRTHFEDGKSTGRGTRYTAGIGLVTWEKGRFVSVDGPAEGGSLTTVPILFDGSQLEINAATNNGGYIQIQLLDQAGNPLSEWSKSLRVQGDSLSHAVKFNGSTDLSSLSGRPIRIHFRIVNGSLYSFAFRD